MRLNDLFSFFEAKSLFSTPALFPALLFTPLSVMAESTLADADCEVADPLSASLLLRIEIDKSRIIETMAIENTRSEFFRTLDKLII
ncbi:MAG: hypothetical protein IPL01_02885 [Acidobacteria bacterium]|nr:hypothetical protein [Acidobacteriota bacterium]